MAKSNRDKSIEILFAHENEVLIKATTLATNETLTPDLWQHEFQELTREYQKLLHKTNKITRVGDSNQKKLFSAYEKIESQNQLLEEARKQADYANKAKSNFLAIMSHEIRTPMNVIKGMTELTLATSLNDKQRDYLETVQKANRSLLKVIEDILDFSKIEAGKLFLEKLDFNLGDLLYHVEKMMSWPATQKGLALYSHIEPDVPLLLSGDFERLKQILINLVGNAIKFTEKGQVDIHVQRLPAETDDNSRNTDITLQFTVRDTGIGIPEDKRESIFESFSQADRSTTRQYGGTGLGLAICKQLVELMKGSIHVNSTEDGGSEFIFSAVFALGDSNAVPMQVDKLNNNALAGTPMQILLAEDNPTNAKLAHFFQVD